MNDKKAKLLVTGGHLTPALAVINALPKKYEVYYVGRVHALEGDAALSQEYQQIQRLNIPFLPITPGRLQRSFTRHTLFSLLKVPIGFIQALYYIWRVKPDVVLSFGGYVALPVVIAAWFFRIPVVTHEQTRTAGLANKIIGRFANKICVSWKGEYPDFPHEKIILTGNPIRSEVFKIEEKLPITIKGPLLYITGGNLGAHGLNSVLEQLTPKLLEKYTLIHQTGNSQEYKDYQRLEKLKETLPKEQAARYMPIEFVGANLIGWVMKNADLIVSRSGANITAEIIALAKPSILIPLPWSGDNEQQKNAQYLESYHAAVVLPQTQLTSATLYTLIADTLEKREALKQNLKSLQKELILDAAARIIKEVEVFF